MNQGYIYDVPPQLYAMDEVNVRVSSGLRPNADNKIFNSLGTYF